MSAVATILGLLLVVAFIAQFEIAPLPAQMATLELEHDLQVENQLLRLQSVVLAEAQASQTHLAFTSPVTLGSQSNPPWGAGSPGQILLESSSIRATSGYSLAKIVPAPPRWNNGSSCLSGGAGHCSSSGNIDTWNVTNANNTAFAIKVTGNHNSMQYNMSANNDTITIDWSGGDTGFVNFVVNGSDDQVTYNKGGSDVANPIANFYFFGQRDTFNFNPAGSHSGHGGMAVNVYFIGTFGLVCPYGNLSATDTLGTLSTGGSNLNMNVTWWNAVGYTSPPHRTIYPGGSGSSEFLTFQNQTGVTACAFTKTYGTSYTSQYGEGILVKLLNTYRPTDELAYDQGAVVESTVGSSAIMLSPPRFSTSLSPEGTIASLTLVDFVGNFHETGGYATAAVTTTLLSVSTVTVLNGVTPTQVASPLFLNVSTAFPAAWASFFASHPTDFPSGVTCTSSGIISAPYTCLQPPPNTAVRISTALSAQGLTLTTITVQISVL